MVEESFDRSTFSKNRARLLRKRRNHEAKLSSCRNVPMENRNGLTRSEKADGYAERRGAAHRRWSMNVCPIEIG